MPVNGVVAEHVGKANKEQLRLLSLSPEQRELERENRLRRAAYQTTDEQRDTSGNVLHFPLWLKALVVGLLILYLIGSSILF